jgi:hypothetical protein
VNVEVFAIDQPPVVHLALARSCPSRFLPVPSPGRDDRADAAARVGDVAVMARNHVEMGVGFFTALRRGVGLSPPSAWRTNLRCVERLFDDASASASSPSPMVDHGARAERDVERRHELTGCLSDGRDSRRRGAINSARAEWQFLQSSTWAAPCSFCNVFGNGTNSLGILTGTALALHASLGLAGR